jgi:signal transduction histidine kinase
MDEDTRRACLEPFFTTRAARHGLGLAMVYGVAQRHGAILEIESEPGRARWCG